MLDILPRRSTITGVYYVNLLNQLRTAIREKRRGKLSKGVLLQQDNARVHTCKLAMGAVERNGYELIPIQYNMYYSLAYISIQQENPTTYTNRTDVEEQTSINANAY